MLLTLLFAVVAALTYPALSEGGGLLLGLCFLR